MGSLVDDPGYFDQKDAEVADLTKAKTKEETPSVVDKTVPKPAKQEKGLINDPDYFAKRDAEVASTSGETKEKESGGDWVEKGINRVVDTVASVFPFRAKQETPTAPDAADVLTQFAKDKTPEDFINTGGQEALSNASPEELKKFSDANKHIPLTRDQFNKKYELEKSQPISISREDIAQVGEGLKAAAKGIATGAYHIGKDIISTDPESNARLWNDVKSYVSPVFEAPADLGWTAAKVKAGGTRISDIIAEKFGQSPEQSQENAYQRSIVDMSRAQADKAANNNIYSTYLTSPTAVAGIKAVMRLSSPNADDGMLQQQAEELSQQLAGEQAPLDQDIKTLAQFTLPAGLGLGGDMAAAINVVPFAKGLAAATGKLLPRAVQEAGVTAKLAANEAKLAQQVEKAGQVSALGKVAGATANTIENLQSATEEFATAHPALANIGAAAAKYGPGAYVGYEADKENPLLGAVLGAGIERAGLGGLAKLKAGESLAKLPRVISDVEEAGAASAGGKLGRFEAAGIRPESSELTQKLFGGDRGAKLDTIGRYLHDYGREGVNMTALGLATGAINSDNSDQMRDMVENGIIYGFLGKTLHKVVGTDPVEAARKTHAQDVENHKTVLSMSPESRNNLRPFTEWGTVVEQAQQNLAKVQQNGGDVAGAQKVLQQVSGANLHTREAYRREVLNSITTAHQLVNGPLRAGQANIGIEVLTGKQMYDKLAAQNPNKPAAELQAMVDSSKGIYFPSGAREVTAGAALPEALKASGEGTVFNPIKPTVVVNFDNVMNFSMAHGKSLNESLSHEMGHAIQDIPEFREINKDVYSKLFDIDFKGPDGTTFHSTKGLYSDKELNKMFFDNYLSNDEFSTKEEKEAWAESRGLMRDGQPNEAKIADYMKDEVMADLNGTAFHLKRVDKLDSGRQHLLDWAAIEQQNNIAARAIHRLMGYGGDGKVGNDPKTFTGAKFTPEVYAAHRDAIREMGKLNGLVSTPSKGEVSKAAVSKAQMIKSKALRERYGKDSGLFKTEFKATIFDKDGNAVGTTTVRDPMTKEGTWGEEDGNVVQRSGYGALPQDMTNVQIPSGGTVKISREIVLGPDGETPLMLSAKEAQQLSATRDQTIRAAIDGTDDVGAPGRFQPFSADGLSYSGTFTPKQIEAIRSLPESVVPAKIKDSILRFNKLIAEGQGNRMLIDYASRLDEKGRYKAFSPKIYDVVPIGMGFSKAGNFYVTAVSATRLLNKLELWSDRMKSRLAPWGGDREAFFRQFATEYLPNHLAGKPGETGLDKNPEIALQKKNIFNDFLNLTRKDAEMNNPDRTKVPRQKGDPRGSDPDRTIMAIRADAVADMLESTNTPLPVNYGKQLANFLPSGEKAPMAEGKIVEEKVPETILKPTEERTPLAKPVKASNQDVQKVSEEYVKSVGLPYRPHGQAVAVNEELAKKIADHYETAKNEPLNPEVKKSYTTLANEVVGQWKTFEKAGYRATPWTGKGQPYANSAEMMKDVRDNKHLYYFQTAEGYGESGITDKMRQENPMLQNSNVNFNGAENVPVNDVFRVVHDIVGHGANGYEFGPKGEFNAYLEHSRMFSEGAKPALAAETLAQNSWVNYGPHLRDTEGNIAKKGEKGYVPVSERPFAEQKNIALPKELIDAAESQVGTKPGPSFLPAKKLDEAHAKAIESGDMEEAQRLVDERAREAFPSTLAIIPPTSSKQDISKQPLKILYHGTGSDFTEFKSGLPTADDWGLFGNIPTERHAIFFAEEKDFANEFAKARDSKRVIPAYINAKKPLVFDDAFDKYDELMDLKDPTDEQKEDRQTYRYIWNLRDKWEAFDGESGKEFVDWMRRKGYDSAILSETGYGLDDEPTQDVWAVLEPSQIKSADPATYDNEGKLIPLSQRFDTSKSDIRFMPAGKKGAQASFEDFNKENVKYIVGKKGWAIMTAENPKAQQLSDEENKKLNEQFEKDMAAQGIKFKPVIGKYGGNPENSYIIIDPNLTHDKAQELAKKYDQDSVLTPQGFVYQDGSLHASKGVNLFDEKPEDYFTTVPSTKVGDTHFSIDLDWDTKHAPDSERVQAIKANEGQAGQKRPGITSATELAKERVDDLKGKLDSADDDFFTKLWPSLLKKTGLNLKASSQNLGKAASIAVNDVVDWLKTNKKYQDYYHTDRETTKQLLKQSYPEMTDDDFGGFMMFMGLTSPSTKLKRNVAEALRVFDLWKKEGSVKSLSLIKTPKGNIGVGEGPFKLIGPTAANKLRTLHYMEDLHNKLGSWDKVSEHLQEPVTMKELNAFNRELGYSGGIGKAGEVKQVVKEATGQDQLIPRMFVFGHKVGAYTLNHTGDDRYTTTDIWEGRFVRSHFPEMFKKGSGLPTNVSEHKIFQTFSSKFNETFKEKTGLDLSPAALQAARWFFMIAKANEAGYKHAKTNGTISEYTEEALRNLSSGTPDADWEGSDGEDPDGIE